LSAAGRHRANLLDLFLLVVVQQGLEFAVDILLERHHSRFLAG
jgi:hypothetical protein